jgi:protein-S-isoprenylcysteine O-methyltransferase Ste14
LQAVFALPPFSDRFNLRLAGGTGFACLGLSLGAWALRSLRRAGQAPDFGVAVSVLVQDGAYRFSRNPLYVALLLVYGSFTLSLASGWLLAGFPLLIVALDRLVVAREERFLSRRFGGAFADYRQRVRRWL